MLGLALKFDPGAVVLMTLPSKLTSSPRNMARLMATASRTASSGRGWVWPQKGRLFAPAAEAENRPARRQIVHGRVRGGGQGRVADVRDR